MSAIEGTWKLELKTPIGNQEFTLVLADNPVTGQITTADGTVELKNLVFSGDSVNFEFELTKPMAISAKGSLTAEGDTISGTVRPGPFPAMPISGTRV